ncbi:MAG: riboflavin synthase subunit alpha [Actinobacteria bacterium RBG_16_68_21]|nr:MAG: riboflavin synthase subunit alpha [Actinobacteria bacterium RBG_16_68_21]
MFTGIVAERGVVRRVVAASGGTHLTISGPVTAAGLAVGDSIAINGVCLTAVVVGTADFEVEAVAETLRLTNLGDLSAGSEVNLERPVSAAGRFDGHFVQGHVDGVAVVRSVAAEGDARRVWLDPPASLIGYVASKGSVALDGVSLTVSGIDESGFEVVLIPHTREVTTFGTLAPGTRINLEVDVLAKYVARLLEVGT